MRKVPTAEGIVIGKTQVLYKGISAGVVKDRTVTEDLQNVILHIEMDKKTRSVLNENTQFWIVEPRISLSGVSGLDTLIGGRYISIATGASGQFQQEFTALNVPPPPANDTPGLHIKLRLNHLKSIDRGTVIYYKKIPVGEITNYTLEENDTEIHAWVLIKPKYAHLVKDNSHFYNVSGVTVNAGLSGVKVKTESLVSVLAGGIAFYNPKNLEGGGPAKHGQFYLLYDDFESAKVGTPVVLRFKNTESIQENITEIKYQGHSIGRVGSFSYDKTSNEMIVLANIDPLLENALRENTQFWLVKPSVSLINITGLDALLSGNYIQMRPALEGKEKREFRVSESVPALDITTPGLHIVIESEMLGSLNKGSPIYYKNIPVGNIEAYKLNEESDKIEFKAFIKPEFAHLVKKHSHFYNASGLNITGGLSGLKIKTESLTSLIKGGIAFYTPDLVKESLNSENNDRFKLYDDYDDAKAGIEISLIFDTAMGLTNDVTKIVYKGMVLGTVSDVTPNKGQQTVTAKVIVDPIARDALVEDTKFWMVKPKISLGEIKNIETLIKGEYVTLRIGSSTKKKSVFRVSQRRPPLDHKQPGLHLKLSSSELGSISVGAPVMYNRIKIGDVQDYELAKDRSSIDILIHIWPQYSDIVSSDSRFYNASGFQVDASLAGIEVKTESFESILKGGIALYNEKAPYSKTKSKNQSKKHSKVQNGRRYTLFKDYKAARLNAFYVQVQFTEPKGLVIGSNVKYRGMSVGQVDNIELNKKTTGSVWVTLELDEQLKPLLGPKSLFWINTAKIGLTNTENLDALVKGSYITVQPQKGNFNDFFIGLDEKPLVNKTSNGFNISLTASRLSSIKTGDPVYYRQIKVGQVVGYELADTADQILVHLRIRNRFKPLIRENSQFWHASGVAVDINLFGNSSIRTESLESIISGGIAFATPDNANMGKQLSSGSFFVLHEEPKPEWLQWNPIIHLKKETQQD